MQEYLEELHRHLLVILKELDRVCRKNNIQYFLVGGTLLGKEIHNGFIPWDDDIDVGMLREDYEKFLGLPETEFSDCFYVHSKYSDKEYWLPFIKLKEKGTVFIEKGRENRMDFPEIYLDIFPFELTKKKKAITKTVKYRRIRHLDNYINYRGTKRELISKSNKIYHCLYGRSELRTLSDIRDRLQKSFNTTNYDSLYDIAGGRSLSNSFFDYDQMFPLNEADFLGIKVFLPKNPAYYLKELYTERYKIIPEESERITHEPIRVDFGGKK